MAVVYYCTAFRLEPLAHAIVMGSLTLCVAKQCFTGIAQTKRQQKRSICCLCLRTYLCVCAKPTRLDPLQTRGASTHWQPLNPWANKGLLNVCVAVQFNNTC